MLIVSASSPGSCTPVSPQRLASAMAASIALRLSARVGVGIAREIRLWALSTKTHAGAPEAVLMILQPAGSGLDAENRTSCIERAYARYPCPLMRVRTTG